MTEDKEQAAKLRSVLKEAYGITAGPRTGVDKLKLLIANAEDNKYQQQMLKANKQQLVDPVKEKARLDKEAARAYADRMKTEDEIRDIIKPYLNRGVEIKFNGDETWTMGFRGRYDSGHMTASPQALTTVAAAVSRGAYKLKTVDVDALGVGTGSLSAQ